ncbi:MAG: hypothetical protein K5779_02480 [Saccharofermentans sp.]|nr:hypothetical protein [Saccharofermentans sp.]
METESSNTREEWLGKEALIHLAGIYQQLYLRPGPEGAEEYKQIVSKGMTASVKDLTHFRSHPADRCFYEDTPAGSVLVITLHYREDFELFLQIMANRCMPYDIPATQGAAILDGVVNWKKINAHRTSFMMSEKMAGNPEPDWNAEFKRFVSNKQNFKDAVIILSQGPYSAVPAEAAGMTEEAWIETSMTIRRVHECTHFICRRMYPDKIDAVWDELVADAAGIYAAVGRFDLRLAELFLGITQDGYKDGRLQNYADGIDLDELAVKVHAVLMIFDEEIRKYEDVSPFDIAIMLEDKKETLWK